MSERQILHDDDAAVVESMVGHTITRAEWYTDPEAEWSEHERARLFLDDGRVIEFGGWGHDAWGATVEEIELVDVEKCNHCGKSHPESVVFTRDPTYEDARTPARYAFCIDGNHRSWRDPSRPSSPVEDTQ